MLIHDDPGTDMPKDPIPRIPSINDIKLNYLRATPASIRAGDTTTIEWSATLPAGLSGVTFTLNGARVSASGRHAERPVVATSYSLVAERFGISRFLGTVAVAVDTSTCTLVGPSKPVADLELLIQIGLFATFSEKANYSKEVGPFTLRLVEDRLDDATFTFDTATGLLHLTVPLKATIDGVAGDGSLTPNIWFQLVAGGGKVVALSTKVDTSLSLPWGLWAVVLLDPIHGAALMALLNGIGPQLASGFVSGALGPIGDLISGQFGDRINAVRIDFGRRAPGDDPEPFVLTTACP